LSYIKTIAVERRFGTLTVLCPGDLHIGPHHRSSTSICICDCDRLPPGHTVTIRNTNLLTGNTTSCGAALPPGVEADNRAVTHIKLSAEIRGIPMKLTDAEIRQFIAAPCLYCGRTRVNKSLSRHAPHIGWNGIDRLDNNLGYIKGNCAACCGIHNQMKEKMTYDQFIEECARVTAHTSVKGQVSRQNFKSKPRK
jgi:hypothetical protein